MKRTHKIVIALVTGLGLGLAAVASADPGFGPGNGPGCQGYRGGPGMGPGAGPGMGRGYGPGMGMGRGAHFGNPLAMAEGHLAWLKAELKITPAQEPAWNTFADQRRQQAEAMQAWATSVQDKAPATAVERMEARSEWAKKRQEQREKSLGAFKTLYAALAPEQKALLDQGFGEVGQGFHGGPGWRMR